MKRLQSQLEAICTGHFSAPGIYNDASVKDIVCLIIASFFKNSVFKLFLQFQELSEISVVFQLIPPVSFTLHFYNT